MDSHGIERVGYVGLGDMGLHVARRIASTGITTLCFDLRPDAVVKALQESKLIRAESVDQIADSCSTVFCCVRNDEQLLRLLSDDGGLITRMRPQTTVVVNSTVRPGTMHTLSALAQDHDVAIVDAPMSGGSSRAATGELTLFVGGEEPHVSRVEHLLEAIASRIVRAGPVGSGQALKIANNIMALGNQVVALEAAEYATAFGVGESVLMDSVTGATGESWVTRNWGFFDELMETHVLSGTDDLYSFLVKELSDAVTSVAETELGVPVELQITDAIRRLGPEVHRRRHQSLKNSRTST